MHGDVAGEHSHSKSRLVAQNHSNVVQRHVSIDPLALTAQMCQRLLQYHALAERVALVLHGAVLFCTRVCLEAALVERLQSGCRQLGGTCAYTTLPMQPCLSPVRHI